MRAARNLSSVWTLGRGGGLFVESSACISDTVSQGVFKLQSSPPRSSQPCVVFSALPTYNVSTSMYLCVYLHIYVRGTVR